MEKREVKFTTWVKDGRKWVERFTVTDEKEVYKELADDLTAHYINKAPYITRVQRTCNYDGTYTVKVLYDNEVKRSYIVER